MNTKTLQEGEMSKEPATQQNKFTPCHHAKPQQASQLHGICVFCYIEPATQQAARVPTDEAENSVVDRTTTKDQPVSALAGLPERVWKFTAEGNVSQHKELNVYWVELRDYDTLRAYVEQLQAELATASARVALLELWERERESVMAELASANKSRDSWYDLYLRTKEL